MPLACNIDARGRKHRYRIGAVLIALGLGSLAASRFVDGSWPWVLAGVLIAGGLFSWFEARNSWCLLRALGFKTRV